MRPTFPVAPVTRIFIVEYLSIFELECQTALVFLFENVAIVSVFIEIACVVDKGITPVAIQSHFEGRLINLCVVAIGRPQDAGLAIGRVNEVTRIVFATGFGASGVLNG